MIIILGTLYLILVTNIVQSQVKLLPPSLRDEVNLTTPEIITKYGYKAETHNIVTQDGYILGLHRILPKTKINKGSVLLMHGILASSTDWIITGPRNGLGYILSDEGYDVWLGNARGNRYSRNHTTLDPNKPEFWDFSFHEIGVYDLPAMIDHILDVTNQSKIFYIAHSQGTTAFFIMCSKKPEYNAKIRVQFSLSPVAFVKHMFNPFFRLLAKNYRLLQMMAHISGLNELMPADGVVNIMGRKLCDKNNFLNYLCHNIIFLIGGFNQKQLNSTILPLILAHVPAGSSVKQVFHFIQMIRSGHFREYDYGWSGNVKRYQQWTPPDYNVTKIVAPVFLFYSNNDWISSDKDVFTLGKLLGNLKGKFRVADDYFNHLDYMFAIQAPQLVYNKIISLMTRY